MRFRSAFSQREMGLGASTLSRWRRRLSRGQAAVGRRGPRKVKPLNFSELRERIEGLEHGGRRSRGSGALHRVYGSAISRRELDAHGARGPQRSYPRSPGRDPSCQLAAVEPGLGDGRLSDTGWGRGRETLSSQPDRSRLPLPASAVGRCTVFPAGRKWPGICSICSTGSTRRCSASGTTAGT